MSQLSRVITIEIILTAPSHSETESFTLSDVNAVLGSLSSALPPGHTCQVGPLGVSEPPFTVVIEIPVLQPERVGAVASDYADVVARAFTSALRCNPSLNVTLPNEGITL